MTHGRHLLSLGVFCALLTPALDGCIIMGFEADCWDETGWLLHGAPTRIESWHTRVEYRIIISISEEVAASELGDAFRTASVLRFAMADDGGVAVTRAGISSGPFLLAAGDRDVVVEDAFGDCGEGACSREFRFWADVAGEGMLSAEGRLTIPNEICEEQLEESWGWVERATVHVATTPRLPPPDAPPIDPPPPPPPACTDEPYACLPGCVDDACVSDCFPASVSPDCLDCVLGANWSCGIEWCPDERRALEACARGARCPAADPCPACDPELDVLSACVEAAFEPHCLDAYEVCFL